MRSQLNSDLKSFCHINTNLHDDRFVGIKVNKDNISINFPIGYQLPESDSEIRKDIFNLLHILTIYQKLEETNITRQSNIKFNAKYPISSYLFIINQFIENSGRYYIETRPSFIKSTRGKTNWKKTIKQIKPLYDGDSLIYIERIIRNTSLNLNNIITKIHKYCVYESFSKLGWMFISGLPEKPDISFNKKLFNIYLVNKINNTFVDSDKKLFISMLNIVNSIDESDNIFDFTYGTEEFEYVWEKMIDIAFGEKDKKQYFPTGQWCLRYNNDKKTPRLEPDSIMIYNDKYFILDAKYYKYGTTGKSEDLPGISSIAKQITYGEYLYNFKNVENNKLFSAFIMPFNMYNNYFCINKPIANIGIATGDWRVNDFNFEKIVGILLDTRYLMKYFKLNDLHLKHFLADCITELN